MPKSSLGRRSSNMRPVRLSELDLKCGSETAKKGDGKKSFLLKPGFSNRPRSSSVDRDSRHSAARSSSKLSMDHKLNRSRSQVNMRTPLVPMTPIYNHHNILPSGSSVRSRDSNRLSSIGTKTSRRDIRPLTDKVWQQDAQRQVTQFFLRTNPQLLEKGSLRPMTTSMFIDLVNNLFQVFDTNIMITNQDYMTRLPMLMKRYAYRGKVEKSWLQTVNTPHSWPHVLGILHWLVEINEGCEDLDLLAMAYPMALEENLTEGQEGTVDFKVVSPWLMKAYDVFQNSKNPEAELEYLEDNLLQEFKQQYGINTEEIKAMEEEIEGLEAELNSPENIAELKELEALSSRSKLMESDAKSYVQHKLQSNEYIKELNMRIEDVKANREEQEQEIQDLKDEINLTKAEIAQQVVSVARKDEMVAEMADLRREIAYQSGCCDEYSNIVYKEDIKIVGTRSKLDAAFLEYNKLVAVNTLLIPQLKAATIDVNILHEGALDEIKAVDETLKELKNTLKNSEKLLVAELNELEHLASDALENRNKENDEVSTLRKSLAEKEKEYDYYKKTTKETLDALRSSVEEYLTKTKNLSKHMPDLKKCILERDQLLLNVEEVESSLEHLIKEALNVGREAKAIVMDYRTKEKEPQHIDKKSIHDFIQKIEEIRPKVQSSSRYKKIGQKFEDAIADINQY